MKKLSTEEKAKRYDEAIEIAKEINREHYEKGFKPSDDVLCIFPELAESEDEKIRKALVKYFTSSITNLDYEICGVSFKEVLAWLEKQGEKKFGWSEYDEIALNRIIPTLESLKVKVKAPAYLLQDIVWLKSLKDRVQPQPKQEWSEEDEGFLCKCLGALGNPNYCYEDGELECMRNWLKSIRPKSQWKPSDKQIKALKEACDEHWEPDGLDPLYTLYQDLKRLKVE